MRTRDVIAYFFGALHFATLGVQNHFFPGLGVQGVQLGNGVAQEIFFFTHGCNRCFKLCQSLARRRQRLPRLSDRLKHFRSVQKLIQDIHMSFGIKQAPIIMLAMQFNQRFRERPQDVARTASIVDPSGFPPVTAIDPAQDQLRTIG